MHRVDMHAALGDHPPRDRAVNAAGKQQRRAAVRADGHTADRRNHLHIQVRHVADFHVHGVLGLLHIHGQVLVCRQDAVSHFDVDGGRIHEVVLVRAARRHAERAGQIRHHGNCLIAEGVKIVFGHFDRRADAVHAEHLRHAADALIQIVKIRHENASVVQQHRRVEVFDGILDALDQRAHKKRAILPLQENLAITDEQQIAHRNFSP